MKINLESYLKKTDAILISNALDIKYLTGFTAFSEAERECFLLITKRNKYLITDRRYTEAVKKLASGFRIIDMGATRFISEKNKTLSNIKILGIQESDLTVEEYKRLKKQVGKIIDIDLSTIRVIKTTSEIKKIEGACGISDLAFEHALTRLKLGITEKDVASEIVSFIREKADDVSFHPIVAFGKNASVPHHESGNTKLKENTIVLLDLGALKDNYCSDLSRTIFFGKPSKKFKNIYLTVLRAQEIAIKTIKPGVKATEIDEAARNYIISKGYPDILHSVGHGIGIEVHESPLISLRSKDVILENMVFTIEPGIYLPGYGGVRIEDMVVVRKNKGELISHSRKEIIEVDYV